MVVVASGQRIYVHHGRVRLVRCRPLRSTYFAAAFEHELVDDACAFVLLMAGLHSCKGVEDSLSLLLVLSAVSNELECELEGFAYFVELQSVLLELNLVHPDP